MNQEKIKRAVLLQLKANAQIDANGEAASEVVDELMTIVDAFTQEERTGFLKEYAKPIPEAMIEYFDDEDFSFWSDRYKEEVGVRPRMDAKKLIDWVNENFVRNGNKYEKITTQF